MSETFTFMVEVPRQTMEDLALNLGGFESIQGTSPKALGQLLERVIMDGLEEHLGEADDFTVTPSKQGFVVEIPKTSLEDVALNMYGDQIESLADATSEELSGLMSEIISAGLEEYVTDCDFKVRSA
jgi:hypothetical protein